jgi:chaperone required for assembly of F1-ATPase
MSGWAARRFWTDVTVVPDGAGFGLRLDARAVRTPLKAALVMPTEAMAVAAAAEWRAQQGVVNPETMPVTRYANSAIDKVAPQFDAVTGLIAAYGGTDLICYRAERPQALVARQAAAWDPLLTWAATALAAPLVATTGVMHVGQPVESQRQLQARVAAMTPFQVAALHDLVAISGSLILGLAVTEGQLTGAQAWAISRIDEDWQIEEWGEDAEAGAMAAHRRAALLEAERFYRLCGSQF